MRKNFKRSIAKMLSILVPLGLAQTSSKGAGLFAGQTVLVPGTEELEKSVQPVPPFVTIPGHPAGTHRINKMPGGQGDVDYNGDQIWHTYPAGVADAISSVNKNMKSTDDLIFETNENGQGLADLVNWCWEEGDYLCWRQTGYSNADCALPCDIIIKMKKNEAEQEGIWTDKFDYSKIDPNWNNTKCKVFDRTNSVTWFNKQKWTENTANIIAEEKKKVAAANAETVKAETAAKEAKAETNKISADLATEKGKFGWGSFGLGLPVGAIMCGGAIAAYMFRNTESDDEIVVPVI